MVLLLVIQIDICSVMKTYLAVPISAETAGQVVDQVSDAVASGAELVELRTDYIEDLTGAMVRKLIEHIKGEYGKTFPIIVTCRDIAQGGAINYPIKMRIEILVGALEAGADFVDFEYENFLVADNQEKIKVALADSIKGRLILSHHDFDEPFKNIAGLYRKVLTFYPPAIPKLIYTAEHINDCFEGLDLLYNASEQCVVFAMGQAGMISRVLAKKYSSLVTFASLGEEEATAPGQITVDEFKNIYRYDAIDCNTELYGIIADPVGHSMSPAIHNAGFADVGFNKLYLPLLIEGRYDEFETFMDNVLRRSWLGFKGFSVTIPHKENALEYIKAKGGEIEPLAEKIGAVNTIIIGADGKLFGYNTDYAGAIEAIANKVGSREKLAGMNVAVIGAGGVSRAIVAGLVDAGAKVKIYNRTTRKAKKLAKMFGCEYAGLNKVGGIDAELLVNCTSVGMSPESDNSPVPIEVHSKGMVVFDTVYNPLETLLLTHARACGADTIDGLEMFVNQAMMQFELFTGAKGNRQFMRETVLALLEK